MSNHLYRTDNGQLTRKKVVLIEDDSDFAELIRLALAEFDLEIIHATGGMQGLKIAERYRPDLIVLDLMMPAMNGWDVYRRLKEHDQLANIPVLVVTALRMRGDRYFGEQVAKVDGYFNKPFLPSKLRERVSELLGRSPKT